MINMGLAVDLGHAGSVAEPLTGAISLPDGTVVRGRGRREPLPAGPLPDFGLYLGRPPDRARRFPRDRSGRTDWRPDWPAEWIDWPDFSVPRDDALAAEAIQGAFLRARSGQRVEVACVGGTGRTGTVLACMAILAGHPGEEAVTWVRQHYRARAVETPGQRRWVRWFAAFTGASGERDV